MVTFETLSRRLYAHFLPMQGPGCRNKVGVVRQPLICADGMGVDSTAYLVALARLYKEGNRAARPDLILFADPGREWPETYWYRDNVRNPWLKSVGFPEVITVKYEPVTATYDNLYDNCLQNATFPGIVINKKDCSQKFKRQQQDKFCNSYPLATSAWACGLKCIKVIGYDAGPKDMRRSSIPDDDQYVYWYPLRELGWDRDRCIEEIRKEGLPGWSLDRGGDFVEKGGIPVKSACTFCTAMKPHELDVLCRDHPHRALEIVALEAAFMPYYNPEKIEGMWRTSTKKRPGSMTKYILDNQLLPEADVLAAQDRGRAGVKEEVKGRRTLHVISAGAPVDDEDDCGAF